MKIIRNLYLGAMVFICAVQSVTGMPPLGHYEEEADTSRQRRSNTRHQHPLLRDTEGIESLDQVIYGLGLVTATYGMWWMLCALYEDFEVGLLLSALSERLDMASENQ